jgi:hypothetical protein
MLDQNAQIRVIDAWMSAIRQITSLRDVILTARMDIKRERTLCSQQEAFFESLMDAFVTLLNSVLEHGSYLQCKNDLDDLSKKMLSSKEDLKMLRQRSSRMEDGLSSQEYRLTKLEEDLYQRINTEYEPNSTQTAADSSRTSNTTKIPMKANRPEDPASPRDEFYSRMGDLRILLDRLGNFEHELRQELDERDLLRATGQIRISDDTDFFAETRNERAKLQKELEDTQADVKRLKQLCIYEGIEFEDIQFHNPFYLEAVTDETYSKPPIQAEAATLPRPESSSGIISSFLSTQDKVKDWLKDPSSSEPLPTGTAERLTETARRESFCSSDWEMPHSWLRKRRPSSARSEGNGEAALPPPGSQHHATLLEQIKMEPSGRNIRKSI